MEKIDLKTLLLLLLLKREGMIGRYRFKEMLSMQRHEGVVRRMLEDLTKKQWVNPSRSGCILTEYGEKVIAEVMQLKGMVDVFPLDLRSVGIGPESAIVHLRNGKIVGSLLALRDIAVKMGARGAIILTFRNHRLGDLSVYKRLSSRHPEITVRLEKSLRLQEDDIVIVGFAENYPRALEGALAVGLGIKRAKPRYSKCSPYAVAYGPDDVHTKAYQPVEGSGGARVQDSRTEE